MFVFKPHKNVADSRMTIALLSLGHLITDCYSSAFGPLLPLLIDKLHLSLGAAGLLGGVAVFSASVMQPIYGYLSDRHAKRVFVVLGPAVAGAFMSCLGLAPNHIVLLLFLILGGAGTAAFHPQGAAITSAASGCKRGFGMSIFITSGNIGSALGPIVFSSIVLWVGLERAYIAAVAGIMVSALLFLFCPPPNSESAARAKLSEALRTALRPLLVLYFLVVIRSAVQIVLVQFLVLYLIRRGYSLADASRSLSLFLLLGSAGGFAGGLVADRFGEKRVIRCSMLFSAPFLLGFLLTGGLPSLALLMVGGTVLLSTMPVNVIAAQNLVPQSASTVSALMMGFAYGTGGLVFVPITGRMADKIGLHYALMVILALPFIGYLISLALPGELPRSRQRAQAASSFGVVS